MKKLFTFFISLFFLLAAFNGFTQTTYTWNQTGTADWTVAVNWTPARTTPAINDILQFTTSGVFTVTNVPAQTIGQLKVTFGDVNLQAGASGNILTIGGGAGDDLVTSPGTQLNLNSGTNITTIFVAIGATGLIGGTMYFSNAGHRLDAADAGGIIFTSTSIFTQNPGCTGNVFTTTGTNNAIVFNAGSIFVQNDGANPFGKPQPASKVVFNTGNLFIYQASSGSPSFSGRTYADFRLGNTALNSTVTGANAVSIDNLYINGGTLNFNMTGNPGHSIKGNITVAAIGILNFIPASAATINLSGTTPQTITNNGTMTFGINQAVDVNNTAGVTLNSNVVLNNNLNFTAGNITIGNNDLTANTVAGYSATSHVVTNGTGKLYIPNINAAPVVFPVGVNGTTMNTVAISNGLNATYGARVESGLNPAIFINANAVNRTWVLTCTTTPAGSQGLKFSYANGEANGGFNYTANVNHGVFLGTVWNINQSNLTPTGTYNVDAVTGIFSAGLNIPMVIGNLGAILATNHSVELTAQKQNNNAQLNWQLTTPTAVKEMMVERSANSRNFSALAKTTALSYTDDNMLPGTNYYRIKITDINGKILYSSIAAVINSATGFNIVSLMPNIVITEMRLNVTAAQKTIMNVVINDVAGRPVQKNYYTLTAGSNQFDIYAGNFAAGMYYLTVVTASGDTKTLRFVKQ